MISVRSENLAEIFDKASGRAIRYNGFEHPERDNLGNFFEKEKDYIRIIFEEFIRTLPSEISFEDIEQSCIENYERIFSNLENKAAENVLDKAVLVKLREHIRKHIKILLREVATKFHLRPYQSESLANIERGIEQGKKTFLIQLPTGTGKTITFSYLKEYLQSKKKMLVLAHRDQLLTQAHEKIKAVNPEFKVSIVSGKTKDTDPDADVIIASVPALGRENSRKIKSFNPEDFFLLVTDEAHHATAPTYERIYRHFREGLNGLAGNPELCHVGFTATPIRGDKVDLKKVFPELTYSMSLREAIELGWLARIFGFRVNTETDLNNVASMHGDFNQNQLEKAVNTPQRNKKVVEAYKEHALGKKTLVFAVDIQHSKDLQAEFIKGGYRAAHVDGTTPPEELQKVIEQLKDGEIDMIVNCNLLTEGFDCPELETIIMARPTQSALLYEQMLGRGTRKVPDIKETMILIDMVDNSQKHALIDAAKIFGLIRDKKEGDLVYLVEEEESKGREGEVVHKMDKKPGFDASEKLEFFKDFPEIEKSFVYFSGRNGSFRVYLLNEVLHLGMDILGNWTVVLPDGDRYCFEKISTAVELIECWLAKYRSDKKHFWHKDCITWMQEPATAAQLSFLNKIMWFVKKYYAEYVDLIFANNIRKQDAQIILSDFNEHYAKKDVNVKRDSKEKILPATDKQIKFLKNREEILKRVKPSFSIEGIKYEQAFEAVKYCKENQIPCDWEYQPARPEQVDALCRLYDSRKGAFYEQLPVQEAERRIRKKEEL